MLRTCTVKLKGTTPYSQSRRLDEEEVPMLEKETHDGYDKRCWRLKATTDANGIVCVPGMAIKMCCDTAVSRLGLKVTEKGRSTFTRYFKSGVLAEGDMALNIHIDDVEPIAIWANPQGRRGGGARVKRRFPYFPTWGGTVVLVILDEIIPEAILERVMHEAGRFVGVGRFRPENGGFLGRFVPESFSWATIG